jgi:hypothetical protein
MLALTAFRSRDTSCQSAVENTAREEAIMGGDLQRATNCYKTLRDLPRVDARGAGYAAETRRRIALLGRQLTALDATK